MIGNKSVLAVIPAKLTSQRLKEKNILSLNGKPLIFWTFKEASKSKYIDKIILSTESLKIKNIAEKYKIHVPFLRPKNLANKNVNSGKVCLHALQKLKKKYDYILLLQPTSPLRQAKNIDKAIQLVSKQKNKSFISIYSSKHKKKNLIYLTKKNLLTKSKKKSKKTNKKYYLNGAIYISETDFLLKNKNFFTNSTSPFFMSEKVSYDIDDINDFLKIENIMKNW